MELSPVGLLYELRRQESAAFEGIWKSWQITDGRTECPTLPGLTAWLRGYSWSPLLAHRRSGGESEGGWEGGDSCSLVHPRPWELRTFTTPPTRVSSRGVWLGVRLCSLDRDLQVELVCRCYYVVWHPPTPWLFNQVHCWRRRAGRLCFCLEINKPVFPSSTRLFSICTNNPGKVSHCL